jgi:glycosyltransferase involved in cell wall biosynthesis
MMDIIEFCKQTLIPKSFDHVKYQQDNPQTDQFHMEVCEKGRLTNRQRLYYHYMCYGGGDHEQVIHLSEQFDIRNNFDLPELSLTVGVKNRFNQLKVSVNSWLVQTAIQEIVVVDWDSDDMDHDYLTNLDDRIKIVHVRDQPTYEHAQVLNRCMSIATHECVIKMDVDYVFNPYYQLHQWLNLDWDTQFMTGFWNNQRMDNRLGFIEHLNGFMCVNRKHVDSIGGYNEQFVGYGWEDCELYIRLVQAGLSKKNIPIEPNFVPVYHMPHMDTERTKHQQEKCVRTSIDNNKNKTKYKTYTLQ